MNTELAYDLIEDNTILNKYIETNYCNKQQTLDRITKILSILKQELDRLEKLL